MPATKDKLGDLAKIEHLKESKDRQKAKEKQMLAEGKKQYSVWIESETNDFKSFLSGKTFHEWFWASTPDEAGQMGLAQALNEGHKSPKIESITLVKEAKKNKNG